MSYKIKKLLKSMSSIPEIEKSSKERIYYNLSSLISILEMQELAPSPLIK